MHKIGKYLIVLGFVCSILVVFSLSILLYINSRVTVLTIVDNENRPYLHFSLDDVRDVTSNLSSSNYSSIFEDSTLATLKKWHEEYGICVSLYVMDDFSVNSKYAAELMANQSWLKWAYHGHGDNVRKYGNGRFYKQVKDSVGTYSIIDSYTRIDYYHADLVTCLILKHYGCRGFLTCDDWAYNSEKRVSNYYLTSEQNAILDTANRMFDSEHNLFLVKTDFRLEQIESRWGTVQSCIDYYSNSRQSNELIVFGHEWNYKDHISKADSIFQWAKNSHFIFDYPMNHERRQNITQTPLKNISKT